MSVHPQIDWVREASEPQQTFRRMVVGWQNANLALGAYVMAFNATYLDKVKRESPDYRMNEIAKKKQIIAALYEVRDRLNEWYHALDKLGALSPEGKIEKIRVRKLLALMSSFVRVRNATFHFGDPLENTTDLLKLYEQVDATDLNLLNELLDAMRSLGERFKNDALARC